jgi:hypothetical protein
MASVEGQTRADLGLFWGLFKWVFGSRANILGEEKTRADLGLFDQVLSCKI